MTCTLITIDPKTGQQLREPWGGSTPAEDMERAARRLKRGREPARPPDAGQGCQSPRYHPDAWWRR